MQNQILSPSFKPINFLIVQSQDATILKKINSNRVNQLLKVKFYTRRILKVYKEQSPKLQSDGHTQVQEQLIPTNKYMLENIIRGYSQKRFITIPKAFTSFSSKLTKSALLSISDGNIQKISKFIGLNRQIKTMSFSLISLSHSNNKLMDCLAKFKYLSSLEKLQYRGPSFFYDECKFIETISNLKLKDFKYDSYALMGDSQIIKCWMRLHSFKHLRALQIRDPKESLTVDVKNAIEDLLDKRVKKLNKYSVHFLGREDIVSNDLNEALVAKMQELTHFTFTVAYFNGVPYKKDFTYLLNHMKKLRYLDITLISPNFEQYHIFNEHISQIQNLKELSINLKISPNQFLEKPLKPLNFQTSSLESLNLSFGVTFGIFDTKQEMNQENIINYFRSSLKNINNCTQLRKVGFQFAFENIEIMDYLLDLMDDGIKDLTKLREITIDSQGKNISNVFPIVTMLKRQTQLFKVVLYTKLFQEKYQDFYQIVEVLKEKNIPLVKIFSQDDFIADCLKLEIGYDNVNMQNKGWTIE